MLRSALSLAAICLAAVWSTNAGPTSAPPKFPKPAPAEGTVVKCAPNYKSIMSPMEANMMGSDEFHRLYDTPVLYRIDKGKFRVFPTPEIAKSWGVDPAGAPLYDCGIMDMGGKKAKNPQWSNGLPVGEPMAMKQ